MFEAIGTLSESEHCIRGFVPREGGGGAAETGSGDGSLSNRAIKEELE